MTETTEPDARQVLADEIVALTILKDAVLEQIETRRVIVGEGWTSGSKVTVTLPNERTPNKPTKVAEVRCDSGSVVARVKDRAMFEQWVLDNSPQNIIVQPATVTCWALEDVSAAAIASGLDAAGAIVNAGDPWTPAPAIDRARAFIDALEAAGYTLAETQTVAERRVVLPAFEEQTLKMSHEATEPVAPGGEIPAGVEVVAAVNKAVVVVGKAAATRDEFIASLLAANRLPQIEGFRPATEES